MKNGELMLISPNPMLCISGEASSRDQHSILKIGNQPLLIVEQYRYLGVIFHEEMKFREAAKTLLKGGGRALGAGISKIHYFKEIGFKTFES